MSAPTDSQDLTPSEEAFAEFLGLAEEGAADFEAFCGERPELAPRLRRLHERWCRFDAAVSAEISAPPDRADPSDSTERLLRGLRAQSATESRYEQAGEIGRGGMGRVIKVWDRDLRRSLAMKVLAEGRKRDARSLARFLDEAFVTGQLEHPGIVPVHELGLDSDGRVYFTMPFVRGEDLQRIFQRAHEGEPGWGRSRVIEVLLRVCEAVGYAHARGVLHRDLKPANVMVGPFGETYVMDWGLARILGDDRDVAPGSGDAGAGTRTSRDMRSVRVDLEGEGSPLTTMEGDVVGTPVYMAPEQAHGWIDRIGPATDVYSIGAMLYHLLARCRPYLSSGDRDSAQTVLRSVQSRPPRPIHALVDDVPPELEAICDKAMAREPSKRYATTMELADDLRAYLEERVVGAYDSGAFAEARSWVRRNRRLATALAGGLLSVLLGLAASSFLYLQSRQNEIGLLREQGRADANAQRLAEELRTSLLAQARLSVAQGRFDRAEDILWRQHLQSPSDQTKWLLWELYARNPLRDMTAAARRTHSLTGTPDGALTLTTGGEEELLPSTLTILEAKTLLPLAELPICDERAFVAVDASGLRAAVACGDGTLREWDLMTRRERGLVARFETGLRALIHEPDRDTWLIGTEDGRVLRVSREGERLREWRLAGVPQVLRRSPDGTRIAAGCYEGIAYLLDAADGGVLHRVTGHGGTTRDVRFDSTGERLFVVGRADRIDVITVATGAVERSVEQTDIMLHAVCPLEDELVVGGTYRASFYDLDALEWSRAFETPSPIERLYPPSPETLTVARRESLVNWDLRVERQMRRVDDMAPGALGIETAPDGAMILADAAGAVRVWDPVAGRLISAWHEGERVVAVDLSGADGIAALRVDSKVRIRRVADGALIATVPAGGGASRQTLSFAPDGRSLVVPTYRTESPFLRVDAETGGELARIGREGDEPISVDYAPTAEFIAFTTRTRSETGRWIHWANVWSPDGRELARRDTGLWKVRVSPDGALLALGVWGLAPAILDARTLEERLRLRGHTGNVWSVDWHPSAPDVVATAADDGEIRLWDLASGVDLLHIDTGLDRLTTVRFGPDGKTVSAGRGEVVVWDLEYFDRHIAGNAAHRIRELRATLDAPSGVAEVEAWADRVLARPWPRFAR